jgi:glycerol uptake facilitator-like aquaporin
VERLRPVVAEFLGTLLLVTIVIGSGIAAERLSTDPGLRLLETSIATALGLAVLVVVLQPVSGAHLNPLITLGDALIADGSRPRLTWGTAIAEVLATAGLVVVVFVLTRRGRVSAVAPAVGAYIGAAYWFTSSTAFANPAVTLGRVLSDTFAGIAPASALGFVAAQIVGAAVGLALVLVLAPKPEAVS